MMAAAQAQAQVQQAHMLAAMQAQLATQLQAQQAAILRMSAEQTGVASPAAGTAVNGLSTPVQPQGNADGGNGAAVDVPPPPPSTSAHAASPSGDTAQEDASQK